MKTPIIELTDCIECEICVEVCPSVFKYNEMGFIEVIDLPEYPEKEVNEAIKNCPADCIKWDNDNRS